MIRPSRVRLAQRRISALAALAVVVTGVACSSQHAPTQPRGSLGRITVATNSLASPSSGFSTTSQAVTTDSKGAPWVVTGFTNINLSLWNLPTLPLQANAWSQTDPLSNKAVTHLQTDAGYGWLAPADSLVSTGPFGGWQGQPALAGTGNEGQVVYASVTGSSSGGVPIPSDVAVALSTDAGDHFATSFAPRVLTTNGSGGDLVFGIVAKVDPQHVGRVWFAWSVGNPLFGRVKTWFRWIEYDGAGNSTLGDSYQAPDGVAPYGYVNIAPGFVDPSGRTSLVVAWPSSPPEPGVGYACTQPGSPTLRMGWNVTYFDPYVVPAFGSPESVTMDEEWPVCVSSGVNSEEVYAKNRNRPELVVDSKLGVIYVAVSKSLATTDGHNKPLGTRVKLFFKGPGFSWQDTGYWSWCGPNQGKEPPYTTDAGKVLPSEPLCYQFGPALAIVPGVSPAVARLMLTWHDTRDDCHSVPNNFNCVSEYATSFYSGWGMPDTIEIAVKSGPGQVIPWLQTAEATNRYVSGTLWGNYEGAVGFNYLGTTHFYSAWSDNRDTSSLAPSVFVTQITP